MSIIPTSTYSATTNNVSSRAAGDASTVRMPLDRTDPPTIIRAGGCDGRVSVTATEIAETAARMSRTPSGPNGTIATPQNNGPRKYARASTAPDAVLLAVRSAVESEISGSSA